MEKSRQNLCPFWHMVKTLIPFQWTSTASMHTIDHLCDNNLNGASLKIIVTKQQPSPLLNPVLLH